MVLLEGRCDTDALVDATAAQFEATPLFRSRVVDDGGPILHRWAWCPDPRATPPRVLDLRAIPDCDDLSSVVDHVYDRGRLARDLRREHPARATIATLRGDLTALALERHHAAADATTTYRFLRDLLARYHRTTTGSDASWTGIPAIHSVAESSPPDAASGLDLVRHMLTLQKNYPLDDVAGIAGTPGAEGPQITVRAPVVDGATTMDLRRRARSCGSSMTDLAVAAAMRAIHAWNTGHDTSSLVQRVHLPVNQRGRSGDEDPNALSLIAVGCRRDDVEDREELLRSVTRQRLDALDDGIDLALARLGKRLMPLAGLDLPQRDRRGPLSRATCTVTNPGILWPETAHGRLTGETALTGVGGLEVVDTMTVFDGDTGSLRLTTFRGLLRLDVAANAAVMNSAEVAALGEMIHGELLGFL